MQSRQKTGIPGMVPIALPGERSDYARDNEQVQNNWKWRQSKAILALSSALPRRFVERMQRRLEKNASIEPEGRQAQYEYWLSKIDTLTKKERALIRHCVAGISARPLISIIMPVHNTSGQWLEKAIESVRNQLYDHWELCIASDAPAEGGVNELLLRYEQADPRIKLHIRKQHGGIGACSNDALAHATGGYIALLGQEDELHETALFHVALEAIGHPEAAILFSDEDKVDARGRRSEPYFKCGFSYELLLAQNLVGHFAVYGREHVQSVDGFRTGFDGAQDWDLTLRVLETCGPHRIRHIPRVLYHARPTAPSSAGADQKTFANGAGAVAVREHLKRIDVDAEVSVNPSLPDTHRITYRIAGEPLASIIIPTYNGFGILKACVSSIFERTEYKNFELIIVDNLSDERLTLNYLAELKAQGRAKVLKYPKPFNYSAINNFAVRQARGDVAVLLNNDTEVITSEWLTEMVYHAVRSQVGAVGALLLYPDGTVQHAGVIVGLGSVAGHAHINFNGNSAEYSGRIQIAHDVSAVTGACLAVRRKLFEEIGGLDERNLPVTFNDIDFCLRLAEKGYRNIYTPWARLYHYESKTRGSDTTGEKKARFQGESDYMRGRHAAAIANDLYYNPNLTLCAHNYSPSFNPRVPAILELCSKAAARHPGD